MRGGGGGMVGGCLDRMKSMLVVREVILHNAGYAGYIAQ